MGRINELRWIDAIVVAAYILKNSDKHNVTLAEIWETIKTKELKNTKEFHYLYSQVTSALAEKIKKWIYVEKPVTSTNTETSTGTLRNLLIPSLTCGPKQKAVLTIRKRNAEQEKINEAVRNINSLLSNSKEQFFSNNLEWESVERAIRPAEFIRKKLEQFQNLRFDEDITKIVLLGTNKVGKSTFLNCFLSNIFPKKYSELYLKSIKNKQGDIEDERYLDEILQRHSLIDDYSYQTHKSIDVIFISESRNQEWFTRFYEHELEKYVQYDEKYKSIVGQIYKDGTQIHPNLQQDFTDGEFLVPARGGSTSTTAFPIIIKNAITPALRVVYLSELDARSQNLQETLAEISPSLKKDYIGADDAIYFSKGENLMHDRLYMKFLVKKIFDAQYASLVKEIVVYLPLALLGKNIALVDVAGTNDSTALKKYHLNQALNSATQLFVILDKELNFTNDVSDTLIQSEFINKMKTNKLKYVLSFISILEKDGISYMTLAERAKVAEQAAIATKQQFLQKLKESKSDQYETAQDSKQASRKQYEALLDTHIRSYFCFPLLFCSLAQSFEDLKSKYSEDNIREAISHTNMMEIYSIIYQQMRHYLVQPMRLLNDCYFDILQQFYDSFAMDWVPSSFITPTIMNEFKLPESKTRDFIRKKLLPAYEKYLYSYLQYLQYDFDDTCIDNCERFRADSDFEGELIKLQLNCNNFADITANLKYEIVSAISNKLQRLFEKHFRKVLTVNAEEEDVEDLMFIISNNLKIFSIYIQVYLHSKFDTEEGLLLKLPDIKDILDVFKIKLDNHDASANGAGAALVVSNLLKRSVVEKFKSLASKKFGKGVFNSCLQTICQDFKKFIQVNTFNQSNVLVLPDILLDIRADVIKKIKNVYDIEKEKFASFYKQFNASFQTLRSWCFQIDTVLASDSSQAKDRKALEIASQKYAITLEISRQKLVFPIASKFAGSVCFEDCVETQGGKCIDCSSCKKSYHFDCYKARNPQDNKTFDYYAQEGVRFFCSANCGGYNFDDDVVESQDDAEFVGPLAEESVSEEEEEILENKRRRRSNRSKNSQNKKRK